MFNVNVPYKHIRLNDSSCRPFTVNDERFIFLTRIVNWLESWESHSLKDGKLSKQTFTSLRHACIVLPQIVNYLTGKCGYAYILTRFLQTDPLEHHFGLYRMMSGSNYHVSYLQILEAERRLKISNLLTLFSNTNTQPSSQISMEEFIQSFSPIYSVHTDIIQSNSELMSLLTEGQTRKILVTLAFGSLTGLDSGFESWRTTCPSCNVKGSTILSNLVRSEANCLIANLLKNYNSSLTLKGLEKRKLKKFDS